MVNRKLANRNVVELGDNTLSSPGYKAGPSWQACCLRIYLGWDIKRPVWDVQIPNHQYEERHGSSKLRRRVKVGIAKAGSLTQLTTNSCDLELE